MRQIKVGVIIRNKKKVLILKRNEIDGGFWQTVTGSVEYNEELEQTIYRETLEETGLHGKSSYPEILHSFIWRKGKEEVIELVFSLQVTDDKVKLSNEHIEYRWTSIDKAIEMVKMENNKIALRNLKKI